MNKASEFSERTTPNPTLSIMISLVQKMLSAVRVLGEKTFRDFSSTQKGFRIRTHELKKGGSRWEAYICGNLRKVVYLGRKLTTRRARGEGKEIFGLINRLLLKRAMEEPFQERL